MDKKSVKQMVKDIEKFDLTDDERNILPGSFIKLSDGITHYEISGEGEIVVLVHGFSTPYFIYDKIYQGMISLGYRVLRYDLYGRGYSDRVEKENDLELFSRQLKEITSELLGNNEFYLFGTSMGGSIVTAFTARYPSLVKKLFLFAPAGMPFKVPISMKLAKIPLLGKWIFKNLATKKMLKGITDEILYSANEKDYYMTQFANSIKYKGFSDSVFSSLKSIVLKPEITVPNFEKLNKTSVPVVCIWGTADKTMPYYQADTLKNIVKGIRLFTFEGSGHLFIFDEGERTLDVIKKEINS